MADFVLKYNFFELNGEVKRQKSGTAIVTKFAPAYACIFMDEVETELGSGVRYEGREKNNPNTFWKIID